MFPYFILNITSSRWVGLQIKGHWTSKALPAYSFQRLCSYDQIANWVIKIQLLNYYYHHHYYSGEFLSTAGNFWRCRREHCVFVHFELIYRTGGNIFFTNALKKQLYRQDVPERHCSVQESKVTSFRLNLSTADSTHKHFTSAQNLMDATRRRKSI